ncbi:hypothetical protein HBI24_020170 [Parastagonospora nodorum]|nr:hypothetical protein HBH47_019230 [Parastagonospora nodorum]KAH4195099.1 hypothetical protein HBH42_088950 [Parastagonospora nodorum]KAH5009920.1 hypothetical protein HBI74_202640 [Parastagonospora nodorum]KAH5034256.1 hypothetical protein HBI75_099190 [Parastagonospora nodorum]KAH5194247.1 hypothetical protein HBH76_060280 [Parastagonospora nodorum]
MLDMLLTADAARKHAHDFSSPHAPSSPAGNGSFLLQMPLSIIGSVLRRQTPSPAPLLPENVPGQAPTMINRLPDTPLASPTFSRPVSSGSNASADPRPGHVRIASGCTESLKKRNPRPRTSYVCARPVRPTDSKLHLRPKVLLQLHQLIPSQRPKPTYELIPFSLLPPRSTRRLARTFNTSARLGPHDLLVVKAEPYGSVEGTQSEHDHWNEREVVGVICPAKGDKNTEICMDDGSSRWDVSDLPNGGFEFNTTDDHGLPLKARWVLKPAHSRRVSSTSAYSQHSQTLPQGQEDKKYTFSTISDNSRRHPIIATLTRSRIDVMDSYTIPPTSLPTPALTPASDVESFISSEQAPIVTNDTLRRLILVTGSWIASQNATTTQSSSFCAETASLFSASHSRSTSPTSTIGRPSGKRLPRSASFTEPSVAPNSSPKQKPHSRRANSTGTANMSGSMRQRYGLAFEGETLCETEEERQNKRSVELLRIRELALPPTIELPSVEPPTERSRKTQSAFEPLKTAGLWDSGVAEERPGRLKPRPTSLSVILDKQKRQDRKRERSKDKSLRVESSDYGSLIKRRDWARIKSSLRGLFKRDKA